MEWNEPVFTEGSGAGGRVGVLLSHGFGGSPRSVQEMAGRLVDAGHSVALPLLSGHGSTAEDMERSRWTEWTADVERAYDWLRDRCDVVFATGLSMGGTLAIRVAEHHPDVAGLITVNAALRSQERTMRALGLIGIPRWTRAIGNDTRLAGVDERAYARIPVRSTRQLALLLADVRENLAFVRCPALLFSSTVDHVVPPANQPEIYEGISSTDKTLVELRDSYHVATMDNDRELVFATTLEFIARRSHPGNGIPLDS